MAAFVYSTVVLISISPGPRGDFVPHLSITIAVALVALSMVLPIYFIHHIAVNDTFTALTCIDWLGDSLRKVTTRWRPIRVHRDSHGFVRVITGTP